MTMYIDSLNEPVDADLQAIDDNPVHLLTDDELRELSRDLQAGEPVNENNSLRDDRRPPIQ